MNGRKILLDSVILIDHFNGRQQATRYLKRHARRLCISVITRAEVLVGFETEESVGPRRLLDSMTCLAIDRDIADLAADLRRRHRWKLPDALQAALALHHGYRLITRNTKDFPPGQHEFVETPYTLPSP